MVVLRVSSLRELDRTAAKIKDKASA